jgi:hypothetical protein
MLNLWKDIQYAFRTLTKNPGFAIIGIVTLALGMAVNTTLFSVVNGFLLRPLPVPHPEQITVLSLQQSSLPGARRFSYPDFEDFRTQTDSSGWRSSPSPWTKRPTTVSSAESPTIFSQPLESSPRMDV